ncbi:hypothetical protein NQ317_010662 [Molorchus minor]|uniref:Uncharacterized protein n=1 Tax=Molorchus minor TaxID=1323400 RepID=A0ABQ9K667_9CUCU|nr:hypothetical protein NQ317_010662 [Molorchus minor]
MEELMLSVNIVLDNKTITVPYTNTTTAEDVCIQICKKLNIGILTYHLFALRITGKTIFLMPAATFGEKNTRVDFRVRFKVADVGKLAKIDINAYNYYFHQVRNDVLDNKVPDIIYEKYRRELVGLGITDMYRVMLEKELPKGSVEKDYKKYIPKEVLKRHPFFIKKPIHDTLSKLQKSVDDASYVKAQYLKQLDNIAPEYLSETYKAILDHGDVSSIVIKLSPFDQDKPGINLKYFTEAKKEWQVICRIEDLVVISIRNDDGSLELSRRNGIPFYLKFNSKSMMYSFISLVDGYYRLTCIWTFSICKEVYTPSLQRLHTMKCHGPVGGEFSYAKLEAIQGSKAGYFIIRESESNYNHYYIDVCIKDGVKPKTFKLEKMTDGEFIFNDDLTRYKNIHQLMAAYNDPKGAIYLHKCVPPSEYDDSPLLLCKSENKIGDSLTNSALEMVIPTSPVCISCKDLQVYKGLEYYGPISKTESRVRCQSWTSDKPHRVRGDITDDKFPDGSKARAKNYCRNPTKDAMGPWCYTMNDDLQFETCGLPLCAFSECKVTGPDKKCLKWNKERKKVKENGNFIKFTKFDKQYFPENSVSNAKKYCRNPNGDIGGPWCFVENEDTDEIEKEYCNIPFCDDPECQVFTKNSDTYMHYTDFNHTLANLTFGVKLWDPDSYLEATAKLVLSVLPLPLTGKEIEDLGIGIEIVIGNNFSALRYGNKDKPDYEPTNGLLRSTKFTKLSLSWHAGFITFGLEGQIKPIFLAEYKTKKNLLGFKKNQFNYYSAQGTNILWDFPFCKDDFECDVHTTTGGEFQQFWPLREKSDGLDLYVYVRAYHSAAILIVPSPTIEYPQLKIVFLGKNNYTKVTVREHVNAPESLLKEMQLYHIVDYWQWQEFSITLFADSLHIYMKKPSGMQTFAELTNDIFRRVRWFSVSSDNTVAHWSFYCVPPKLASPPPAFLPECALNPDELDYKGTQDITDNGLPCLPWSGKKLIDESVQRLFTNESTLQAKNYCRDPSERKQGTYCYAISLYPEKSVQKKYCHLRKCKSEECRIAGTGNDYIGSLAQTRSNRTCRTWVFSNDSLNAQYMESFSDLKFADLNASLAKNYCRNPSRDPSGSWCYTTDRSIVLEACNVRDCDKPEECIVIAEQIMRGRSTYILPQWKETGIHGGLRFAIKQWDPDIGDGLNIQISSRDGSKYLTLQVGAESNEKIILYYNTDIVEQKTFPHIISTGKWAELWLQMRKGEVMLGFEGVPSSLFEWRSTQSYQEFEPVMINYGTIHGHQLGISFRCDECHTENTLINSFERNLPIGLWSTKELPYYNSFNLTLRGDGIALVKLMNMPRLFTFYYITIDSKEGKCKVTLFKFFNGDAIALQVTPVPEVMTTNSWTKYIISFDESSLRVEKGSESVINYKSQEPIVIYWFSMGADSGWITWSVNCEPLDLDGPPRDGGWSAWSPWTCTVTCGGGEGFRTRTCSNPRPNIFGGLCKGSPTSRGKCNDFPCGDVSPETLEKIRERLQKESFSYVIDEGDSQLLTNNRELLRRISKESPKAYYEWTLNGLFIKPTPGRIIFQGDDLIIKDAKASDSGIYACMLFRINKKRVVLRVLALAVKSKKYDVDTRATRSITLVCNAVILGYIYSDLSMKLYTNDKVYIDHGITVLAAVNALRLDPLNESHSGNWKCEVEQKDLKLSWVTNYVRIRVKKAPNVYTNLMEDKLTAPLFAWLKTETNVLIAIIAIVIFVVLLEMLTLAGQWSFLRTDFLVRLYGITFTSNISLVLEYFRLGPLDEYLRNNWSIIKTVDLLEAGRNLASVLWYLGVEVWYILLESREVTVCL